MLWRAAPAWRRTRRASRSARRRPRRCVSAPQLLPEGFFGSWSGHGPAIQERARPVKPGAAGGLSTQVSISHLPLQANAEVDSVAGREREVEKELEQAQVRLFLSLHSMHSVCCAGWSALAVELNAEA